MSPIIKKWSHPLAGNDETLLSQLMQLAKAESGFYPIGKNGLLHGGVHFDKNTHPSLGNSAVRCIADGEVIAYRIDSEYPTTDYPQNPGACFSTGFVLVRHRLEPTVPEGTSPPPSLTLYSLYMHLQNWASYQANTSEDRPAFWDEKTYRVATQDGNLLVRAEANSNGTELGSLPRGTRVRVAPGDGEYRKLLEIVDGPLSSTLRPDANGHMPGYVAAGYLRPEKEPALIDDVHVPNTPIAIAAGDLIGHPGLYQNRTDSSAEPLLHLEVFSCDDVKDYLKEIRKWAYDNRHTTPKTLLKVHAGSSMLIADRPNANTRPDSNRDKTVGISLIIPQSHLDALPTGYKIATGAQPDHITHWWRLDNLLADAQGQFISGWLAEQNYITTRHSPWEWQGFDHIEDTDLPKNSLAYLLNALRCLTDAELASYRGLIDQSDKGPVKSRLYDIIDTNRDGDLTDGEIKAAIQKPWHAQSIAQLILRQQSEWFWDKEKWKSLDDLLLPRDPGWEFEKQRIEKLSWWDKVSRKNALPTTATAWHLHPQAILLNFQEQKYLIDVAKFINIYLAQHASFQANSPSFSSTSIENLQEVLNQINLYYKSKDANLYELAYMLATARHESWHFLSREYFSDKPEIGSISYFDKYDPILANTHELRERAISNENTEIHDGYKYRGRGLVHLTWKKNYRLAQEEFGVDFINHPERAADPKYSVPIMIWGMRSGIFTGRKLSDYINSQTINYKEARRIINGVDQSDLIAGYARKFEAILRETSDAKESF